MLTFSGEVYNFTELRTELTARGHHFRTRSDTEVVLHAYLQWGAESVTRLNGMFAFGIWDGRRQELLLARDRLGVKPLYYAKQPDGVLFGSEPKAILAHPDFHPEIDAEGLAELFAQVGTATPGHGVYRGLSQVRPGTIVEVNRNGLKTSTYWTLEARDHTDDLAATAGNVHDLLTDIVHRQTVADVPLCSLLSGGLDSSVVSALAAHSLLKRDRTKLATFSVDFAGSVDAFTPDQLRPSHDEPFARAAAEHIGSRHGTVLLTADDLVEAQWAPLNAHDLPTMGDMWVSMYLLSQGDPPAVNGGAVGRVGRRGLRRLPLVPRPRAARGAHIPVGHRGSWAPLLTPGAPGDPPGGVRRRPLRPGSGRGTKADRESPEDRRVREVLYLGLTRWLPLLLDRKDRLSMACGLEVRVPFTDHRLVEYVWNVPWP